MSNVVLLCTVGGSHQPIVKAIRSLAPAYVCFFCTSNDPESGKQGSLSQVTGTGNVIKASPSDARPTLPNIPRQAGLDADGFEHCIVPADDLDGGVIAMRAATDALAARFSGTRFVADYSGGTKTMTAALVCVALDRDDVDLQLVTGARPDLDRVADGTEQPMTASVARLRLDRAMGPYLSAWRRYAYHEAAAGLGAIRIAVDAPDRARLGLASVLSSALARWDDFDHAGAFGLLKPYAARVAPSYPSMVPTLRLLAGKNGPQQEPARLLDLWLNAQRRAAQGRYDDAVARVYRMIEWTGQWLLRTKLGADTADFAADLLPPQVEAHPDGDGKVKLGLWDAWQVVKSRLKPGPAHDMIANCGSELRDLLRIRNDSILAHGFTPVQKPSWERMESWVENRFLPVLDHYARAAGLKKPLDQLPIEPPESVRTPVGTHT